MCALVSGGKSWPGCCNYVLQKTVIDNEIIYGEEESKTWLYNYNVNNLLKSVETEELAIRLMQEVKVMCQAGHFNWTKLISNKKVVIQSISDRIEKMMYKMEIWIPVYH